LDPTAAKLITAATTPSKPAAPATSLIKPPSFLIPTTTTVRIDATMKTMLINYGKVVHPHLMVLVNLRREFSLSSVKTQIDVKFDDGVQAVDGLITASMASNV